MDRTTAKQDALAAAIGVLLTVLIAYCLVQFIS